MTKPPQELDSACSICHADSLTDRKLENVEDFTRFVKNFKYQMQIVPDQICFRFVASSQTNSQLTTDIRHSWSILTRMMTPRHETVTRSPGREGGSVVEG